MNQNSTVFPDKAVWESDGTTASRSTYTSDDLYRKELDRFFYRDHWCYVGLEAEIPNPGDFKRTVVGERSVIMVRDKDGAIHVVENVCAHRGMAFCRERHGNRKELRLPVPPVELHARRATCRACRSAAASSRTARSTAACRRTSSRPTTA